MRYWAGKVLALHGDLFPSSPLLFLFSLLLHAAFHREMNLGVGRRQGDEAKGPFPTVLSLLPVAALEAVGWNVRAREHALVCKAERSQEF